MKNETNRKIADEMKMVPKTLRVAIELDLPTYFTGKPCKHGHISPRYTKNKSCVECQTTTHKELKAKLFAKWQKDHLPDLIENKRIKNMASIRKAKNARKPWTQNQIKAISRRNADGDYVLTAARLAEIMGRSIQSIQRAREAYSTVKK